MRCLAGELNALHLRQSSHLSADSSDWKGRNGDHVLPGSKAPGISTNSSHAHKVEHCVHRFREGRKKPGEEKGQF
jgi:hypothetical protein